MNAETEIREKIRALKSFYTNLIIYVAVVLACVITWIVTGAGPFWPIWVIFACGITAIAQAIHLGQFSLLEDLFPFLGTDWEERQVKELLKKSGRAEETNGGVKKELPRKNKS